MQVLLLRKAIRVSIYTSCWSFQGVQLSPTMVGTKTTWNVESANPCEIVLFINAGPVASTKAKASFSIADLGIHRHKCSCQSLGEKGRHEDCAQRRSCGHQY